MRQIVLDTETTGIGHEFGHRIIEIGCIELVDRKLTGRHFHTYLNPERAVDEGAFRVHGISTEFLADKPSFKEMAKPFWDFVDGAELIIHNAPFDLGFLNAELKTIQWPKAITDECAVIDTLVLARDKHPGQRNNLDALCKRYEIDNSNRQLHGALLDAEILAFVYLAMTGGQTHLFMEEETSPSLSKAHAELAVAQLSSHSPIIFANADEQEKHRGFVEMLVKKSGVNYWDQ